MRRFSTTYCDKTNIRKGYPYKQFQPLISDLLLRGGKPDLSVCDSLEMGVITLYNRIVSRANSELDVLLDETDIDTIICDKNSDYTGIINLMPRMVF